MKIILQTIKLDIFHHKSFLELCSASFNRFNLWEPNKEEDNSNTVDWKI